jgi:hypothetical protein
MKILDKQTIKIEITTRYGNEEVTEVSIRTENGSRLLHLIELGKNSGASTCELRIHHGEYMFHVA